MLLPASPRTRSVPVSDVKLLKVASDNTLKSAFGVVEASACQFDVVFFEKMAANSKEPSTALETLRGAITMCMSLLGDPDTTRRTAPTIDGDSSTNTSNLDTTSSTNTDNLDTTSRTTASSTRQQQQRQLDTTSSSDARHE
ncbi:hypothetical protein PF010_g4106 [Phytophthora fragariae]|uniref:Uncharacterized protein n=1 Tax=Phytophthora fragariae TaxID=53985 RepID=A0A6G0LSK8_9STRA|nr:hypothetical protein PF010_g4106 [Phytophthora fragariae]